jgi:large subunit ribosomal protein L9
MQIILKDDVKGLGYKDDVVDVKPGYGRNFLIPKGLAVMASSSNLKVREENIRQASHKAEKIKAQAEELVKSMGDLTLTIGAKAGESGKIFGAVTSIQVAEALKDKGFDVDRRRITLPEIKMLGQYTVHLDLHKEVKHSITIDVMGE